MSKFLKAKCENMSYVTTAILSTENLLHNLEVIKGIANKSKVMVMLKANAYGHGIRSTAIRLDGKADYFGVARIDEAVALRNVGIRTPIVLMQGIHSYDDIMTAAHNHFDIVIHDYSQLEYLNTLLPNNINVWLKVDTGMKRLGFLPSEVVTIHEHLAKIKNINQIILTSHLACANDKNNPLNAKQINTFVKLAENFPGPRSLLNSAGIFNFKEKCYDIVRPGLAMYGISPIDGITASELNLRPVMTLLSKVIALKKCSPGESIGYGGRFKCLKEMTIGVISIGYGDGYPRSAADGTPTLVRGKVCPIVGRVSMDMLTIDVTECEDVVVGDNVTLWGENLSLEEVSQHTCNIPYDILTRIQLRVKYKWLTYEPN